MSRRAIQKNTCSPQGGFVLFAALILLVIASAASGFFYNRMVSDTRISGATRDNAEAVLLAESAMEFLRGRFINDLDTDTYSATDDNDIPGCVIDTEAETQVTQDKCEIAIIQQNLSAPGDRIENFDYVYYATTGTGITQNSPVVLQMVADGEASNANAGATAITSQAITVTIDGTTGRATPATPIGVNSLFGGAGSFNPFLYELDDDPTSSTYTLLVASDAASWSAETADQKAAAWIEVLQNEDNSEDMDIYVQAVAEVGYSKAYLQRYVGTYFATGVLGGLAALIESSNRDLRDP